MQEQRYSIGVDLHSRVIQVCVLNGQGQVAWEHRERGASLAVGQALVARLARKFPAARVVVESLGMNRWFVKACREHGLDVVVAHASKLGLKKSGRKTDRRDAYELARRLMLGDVERNALSYYPDDEEYGLRQLVRHRDGLVRERSETVSKIRALARNHRIELPTGDLYGPKNLEKLRSVQLENPHEQLVLGCLVRALEHLHQEVCVLDASVKSESKSARCAGALAAPYVGPVTALTLVAGLGDVHRFRNAKAVASYAGLVPRVIESGDSSFHGPLVKHGSRELRFVLGEWAVQLLARHPLAQKWAEPRLKRMPKNKVRVALARKLLIGIWHTLRTGEVFDLERCLTTA